MKGVFWFRERAARKLRTYMDEYHADVIRRYTVAETFSEKGADYKLDREGKGMKFF